MAGQSTSKLAKHKEYGVKLYVDESGNSGADLHDPNQPVFGYAAVWIAPEAEARLDAFISGLRGQFRLQGDGELKGKTLLDSVRGRQAVRALLDMLRTERIPLAVTIVHKRFMAAAVIVEDCTDPVYNDHFTNEWTWNTKLKEPLAEKIMRTVSARVLEAAWRARDGADKDAFKRAYDSALGQLVLSTDHQVSDVARRMRLAKLDDIWDAAHNHIEPGWGYSPNLSAYGSMIMSCDIQGEALGFADVTVVHDNQTQFERAFRTSFEAMVNAGKGEFTLPNGNRQRVPLRCLKTLTFGDSTGSVGIRVADIVAAAARLTVQEFTTGSGSRSKEYRDALRALCCTRALLGDTPFVIGPESWQSDIWRLLAPQDAWV